MAVPRRAYTTDLTDAQWELIGPFVLPETGGGEWLEGASDRSRRMARLRSRAVAPAAVQACSIRWRPRFRACCEELTCPDKRTGRPSFRRRWRGAMLEEREDVGAATLVAPSLALEHFEHGDFIGGQGIAFDDLQMFHFEPALTREFINGRSWRDCCFRHGLFVAGIVDVCMGFITISSPLRPPPGYRG